MRLWHGVGLVGGLGLAAYGTGRAPAGGPSLGVRHARVIADRVQAFAATVAEGVSRDGPVWRAYVVDDPAFFTAAAGRLVFPSRDSATHAISDLARRIARIALRWGKGSRVDALAPGLAVFAALYSELRVARAGRRVAEAGFFTGVVAHRNRVGALRA